ncbi:4Fe-4S dicluster domain-containing protein [Sulfodiicoccus acidiphilus]|uniref:4Fe-4S dicluster domain-containing protein n=1 Tax=Sulfodiicoccus acidiphilus TaxID=1670455 RepID=UPI001E39F3FC|nr:4Fe-4S dicluster domain-containing protein [Sulfodiicoccus acidiphilus]
MGKALGVEMAEIYGTTSPTHRGRPPARVIKVRDADDAVQASELSPVPRYEYSRGVEGEKVADFVELRGVKDLGDRMEVLAGTLWREVLHLNPEVWGNADFSVGGSVYFRDAGFGFNEFGTIDRRVEVKSFVEGKLVEGKYAGGLVYSVTLRKESKDVVHVFKTGNLRELLATVASWYSSSVPPFRDVTLWRGGEWTLSVSYPRTREVLVRAMVSGMPEGKPPIEEISFPHGSRYFGFTSVQRVLERADDLESASRAFLRFSKAGVAISIYYDGRKAPPAWISLADYSSPEVNFDTMGCVMCGRCVYVCPHVQQRSSPAFSPLGVYSLMGTGREGEVSNCHMCGMCESVCPANLKIREILRKHATPKWTGNLRYAVRAVRERSVVITPISAGLWEYALRAVKFLHGKGVNAGMVTLDVDVKDLVLGRLDTRTLSKELAGVGEIITITPEEYEYLKPLAREMVIEVNSLESYLGIDLSGRSVHVPCFSGGRNFKACSMGFLDMLNDEGGSKVIEAEASLCPIAAATMGVKNLMDLAGVQLDDTVFTRLIEGIDSVQARFGELRRDAQWYAEVDGTIHLKFLKALVAPLIKSVSLTEALQLWFNRDRISAPEELKGALLDVLRERLGASP